MPRAVTSDRGVVAWLTPIVTESTFRRWSRLVGIVMLGYLIVRAPVLLHASGSWNPVGIFSPLDGPLPRWILVTSWILALVAAGVLAADRGGRSAAGVLAGAALVLLTHRSSSGQILWFDVLPILHVLILTAGAALQPAGRFDGRVAGWSMRLAALATVATYVVAGLAKLRIGGLDWVADGVLERHIAYSAMRLDVLGGTPSPLAAPLVDLGFASTLLAVIVLVIELGAPIALLQRRAAIVWSVAAWLMHAGIAATMFVVFHWPLFGVAFAPLLLLSAGQDSPAAKRSA